MAEYGRAVLLSAVLLSAVSVRQAVDFCKIGLDKVDGGEYNKRVDE